MRNVQRWYSYGQCQLDRGPAKKFGAACTRGEKREAVPPDHTEPETPQILIHIESGVLEGVYVDRPVTIKVLDLDSLSLEDDLLRDFEPNSTTPADFELMMQNAKHQQKTREEDRKAWNATGKETQAHG
jgi:hypothetical protein